MAKKKTTPSTPEEPASLTPQQFRKIAEPFLPTTKSRGASDAERIVKLKASYQLGELLIDLVPKNSSYGDNQMSQFAEALGYSNGRLSMMRRFAAKYTKPEFDELLTSGLTFGHVGLLLGLSDNLREKYQSEAAKRNWTVADLQLALQQRPDIVKRGGQTMKIADDPSTALRQLVAEGETWKQRCQKTADLIAGKAKISAKLRDQIQETAGELQAMAKAVQGVAKRLAGLE
jgi:hypothetical protein